MKGPILHERSVKMVLDIHVMMLYFVCDCLIMDSYICHNACADCLILDNNKMTISRHKKCKNRLIIIMSFIFILEPHITLHLYMYILSV